MHTAPEIAFHGIERSPWLEDYVAGRARELERYARGITRCHVTLARGEGGRYRVTVEVRVPPQQDLAVRKQGLIRDPATQLPALVNLAFGALERQLKRASVPHPDEDAPGAS